VKLSPSWTPEWGSSHTAQGGSSTSSTAGASGKRDRPTAVITIGARWTIHGAIEIFVALGVVGGGYGTRRYHR